jgi:hypothetical protein
VSGKLHINCIYSCLRLYLSALKAETLCDSSLLNAGGGLRINGERKGSLRNGEPIPVCVWAEALRNMITSVWAWKEEKMK